LVALARRPPGPPGPLESKDADMTSIATQYLDRPGGRLAYEVAGPADGPLVVCLPGIGDLRRTYRDIAERLVASGNRVAVADLRGHGESSVGWPSYGTTDLADDMLALVDHLGGTGVVVGNSMAGGAAVVVAARAPQAISAAVLIAPFVRAAPMNLFQRLGAKLVVAPVVGRRVWLSYWPSLFTGNKPADLKDRRRALAANLAEPGRYEAVRAMFNRPDDDLEATLATVSVPTLVVMGTGDPDFVDPADEARGIAERLPDATVELVDGAGHYPQAEYPDVVADRIASFVREVSCRAQG
nr:alpha/beta hydrolase [Micromonospora sp. DSM 115978]